MDVSFYPHPEPDRIDQRFGRKDAQFAAFLDALEKNEEHLLQKKVDEEGNLVDRGFLGRLGGYAVGKYGGRTSQAVAPALINEALKRIEGQAVRDKEGSRITFADKEQRAQLRRLRQRLLPVSAHTDFEQTIDELQKERKAIQESVALAMTFGEQLDGIEEDLKRTLSNEEMIDLIGTLRQITAKAEILPKESEALANMVTAKTDELYIEVQTRSCQHLQQATSELKNAITKGATQEDFIDLHTKIVDLYTAALDIEATIQQWPWNPSSQGEILQRNLFKSLARTKAEIDTLLHVDDAQLLRSACLQASHQLLQVSRKQLGPALMQRVIDASSRMRTELDTLPTTPEEREEMAHTLACAEAVAQTAILNEELHGVADALHDTRHSTDLAALTERLAALRKKLTRLEKQVAEIPQGQDDDGNTISGREAFHSHMSRRARLGDRDIAALRQHMADLEATVTKKGK